MDSWRKYALIGGLLLGAALPVWAQLTLTPRVNEPLPLGSTREYGTPRVGYGLEVGYRFLAHWRIVVAYDQYRFGLHTGLDKLNVNATLARLLNLPETVTLDLSAGTWSGGLHYLFPLSHWTPYLGVEGSTNRIEAYGYGLSVSQRYGGLAPVLGVECSLTPRWSVRLDTRLQTVFIRNDIPFVDQVIDRHLTFIPIQVGVVANLPVGPLR